MSSDQAESVVLSCQQVVNRLDLLSSLVMGALVCFGLACGWVLFGRLLSLALGASWFNR